LQFDSIATNNADGGTTNRTWLNFMVRFEGGPVPCVMSAAAYGHPVSASRPWQVQALLLLLVGLEVQEMVTDFTHHGWPDF
jgi:hypothetical protein